MSALEEIEEIKKLKARYFRFLDTKNWAEFPGVFAPGANIAFPEIDVYHSSGESFTEFAKTTMENVISVHAGHMPEIALTSDNTATGIWAMTDDLDAPKGMPQSNGAPVRMRGAGHYFEDYVKIDGAWKIASMTLKRLRLDLN